MKTLLLVLSVFLIQPGYSQDFSEKPYTFIEKQILSNLTKTEVKNNLPNGYSITSEESDKIVAQKSIKEKKYDIRYFYENENLTYVEFTLHTSWENKLLIEIEEDLEYMMDENIVINNVETTVYSKEILNLSALMICNLKSRTLTGKISKVKH